MATVFLDAGEIILVDFLEKDKIIIGAYYTPELDQLDDDSKEKIP